MNLLSNKNCNQILQGRFTNSQIKYISHDLKPISENTEGLLGEHYKLKISYLLDDVEKAENFFMKTKGRANQMQIDFANHAGVYKREIFMYDILFKEFGKYGYDISFAPKTYYCIPDETIIMEDLIAKGYKLSERKQLFGMDKLRCGLKSVAQYHAAGFAYDRMKSKQIGETYKLGNEYPEMFAEVVYRKMEDHQGMMLEMWKANYDTIDKVIDVLPYDEEYKREFKILLKNYPLGKSQSIETQLAKTCGHGDLWSNNMMFQFEGDTAVTCCLVDFQFCRYFYPAMDIVQFIFINTDAGFRQHHLDELYQYYYNALSKLVLQYGCPIDEIMTIENFYESINVVKVDTLLLVAGAMGLIYLSKETLTESVRQGSDALAKAILYNRSNLVVDAYGNDSIFRKRMTESMRDLREALHDESKN